MENRNAGAGGGITFLGLLAILFIGLKLTGYIDWEWWVVLAPIWAPAALLIAGAVVYVAYRVVKGWLE